MQTLFWLGRHGTTILNESNKYRGWSDGPDAQLDENGIQMAHEQGKWLQALQRPFTVIFSSPLGRAVQTAEIAGRYIGEPKIIIDDRLRPLNVGRYAGTSKSENKIEPFLKNHKKKFPGGESIDEFENRQYDFALYLLDFLENLKEDAEVLVEAHTSNSMYWWNAQHAAYADEYLDEKTDILLPGGMAMVTPHVTLPVFRANEEHFGSETHTQCSYKCDICRYADACVPREEQEEK